MPYPTLTLKEGREKVILDGHPWLFSGAVQEPPTDVEPGSVVLALDYMGRPLALGFYHPHTDIAFRVLTTNPETPINEAFFLNRIKSALLRRRSFLGNGRATTAYRIVNAEGDGLPGLIVDCYGEYLVLGITTAGMERFRNQVISILVEELAPKAIFEKSQGRSREREGLTPRREIVFGREVPPLVQVKENGIPFWVDILGGQKTGFYLDQRVNRQVIGPLARDKSVLNGFSYTGSFAVYSLLNGAKEVVSVDNSSRALEVAQKNMEINGLKNHRLIKGDMFEYLRDTSEKFDLIILDPPAFAKSIREKGRAVKGYRQINGYALRRLSPNGLLATFSCSNALSMRDFELVVSRCASQLGVGLQLIQRLGPGPDHPTLLSHPEGSYLKGLLVSLLRD
jgi:23S rRNA (cytosine1962-C5)-methyltransferase